MWKIIVLLAAGIFSGSLAWQDFGIFSRSPKILTSYPECKADFNKIAVGLMNNQLWALKIVDASTKIPSGILTGHLTDYGNYDECLEHEGPFNTQYCLATIYTSEGLFDEIMRDYSNLTSSLALRWSYCIPASCPPIALQVALQELVKDVKLNVSVSLSDCKSKNSRVITKEDYFGMLIWGIFVGLAVFSTIYDVVVDKTRARKNAWLSSFSLYTNGKNLLKTEVSSETMLPLHGLRFLSICWVVLGHRYFLTASSPLLNAADFAEEIKYIRSQFFIQGVLAVDTFFFLSGLLNCFHFLKVLEKLNRFPVRLYYIHRYIRLTPALAAVVLMYATWYSHLGDGPAWEQITSVWKQLCVDNWWRTLLYINNYSNPISQCAGQSWYLAVDMQLYWLSPLIILPLWKRPRFGKFLLGVLLLLSIVSQFVIAFIFKFRMSFSFGLSSEEFEKVTKLIYVPTHTRATPYVIGIFIGYHLFNLKKTNTRLVMSKGFLLVGWLLSTLIALSVMFGNFQFSRPIADHPYNQWESSAYIALHRIGWSVAIGWIIIVCLNNQGGAVNTVLSWKVFVPLSRLTYCIFLSHMAIQQYHLGTLRTPDYFQYFNQIHRYFGDLFSSVLAAGILSLVFESPIMVLEKLFGKKPQEKNLKSEVNKGFRDDSNATDKAHEI